MYQQLQDGPYHLPAALPAAQPPQHQSPRSSSFSPQPRPCPCCPSLILPALFSDRFSTAFFSSCCLLWLSVILSITAVSVADFMRLTAGSSVTVSLGAWRVCSSSVGRYACQPLTQAVMDALQLDAVVWDGFRAFLILSILMAFAGALLSTVRLVLQQQRLRVIPRWADVSIITVCTLAAACFVVAFALFLDCFRLMRGSKGYGSSFVCLMVAAGVGSLGLVVHSIAWHFLANDSSRSGRAASEPQPLMMQQLQHSAAAAGQQQPQHGPYSLAPYISPQPYYSQYPFSSPAAHQQQAPSAFPAHYGHASAPFLHPPPPSAHLYAPPGQAQYAVHSYYSPAAAAFAAPPASAAPAVAPSSPQPPAQRSESPHGGAVASAPAAAATP